MANPFTQQKASFGLSDYDLQEQQVARARQYAEALQQQSVQPDQINQMVGDRVVKYSPIQGATKLAQALLAKNQMQKADERAATLAKQKQSDYDTDAQTFSATKSFDVSQYKSPEFRQMAMAQLLKGSEPGKFSTTPQYDQQGRAFILNEKGDMRYLDGVKQRTKLENVNGVLTNMYDGTTQGPAPQDLNKPFYYGPQGQPMANTGYQTYETNKAKAGATNVKVDTGAKAFDTELGKIDAKKLEDLGTKAETAKTSLATVANLRSAVQKGVFEGGGAGAKTAAASLLNGITGIKMKELEGSQLFNAEASKLVLDHIKGLGANPSNADRDFIEKTVPMLATSAEARTAMIDFIEQKAMEQIQLYEQADEYARTNKGFKGFKPAVGKQAAGADIFNQADAIISGGK